MRAALRGTVTFIFVASIISFHAAPASARPSCKELLVNGSFEQPVILDQSYDQPSTIPGWQLSGGTKFELQRNIMGPAADGQQYLELASDNPISILQAIATKPGGTYLLHVSYSPRPGVRQNDVEVKWGDKVVTTLKADGSGRSRTEWQKHSFALTADGSSVVLELVDRSSADGAAGFIDNLRLCELSCRNEITNGSFESPLIRDRSYLQPASLPGWRLSRGTSFELQRNILGPAADGNQYVELASDGPISIQPMMTAAAGKYMLRFAYSPRPGESDNSVDVVWDGKRVTTLSADGDGKSRTDWRVHSFLLEEGGRASKLEFADVSTADGAAGFIDDVRLCRIPSEEKPLSVTASHTLEYGCDRMSTHQGTVELHIQGGKPPYVCTGPAANFPQDAVSNRCSGYGLSLGHHTFNVTDADDRSAHATIDVEWVVQVEVVEVTPPSCRLNNGSATVRVSGENPEFTLRWSDPKQQTTRTATGLAPGTYRVWVFDAKGCRAEREIEIPNGCSSLPPREPWNFN